jgi:nucleotide-binding universal stress UspA family protein
MPGGRRLTGRDLLSLAHVNHERPRRAASVRGTPLCFVSMAALAAARAIATRTGATIEPLIVLPVQSIPYGQPIEHRWSEVGKQLTPADLARLGSDDLDGRVSYGSPGEELACLSEEVDLLIVGSRSSGPVGRLFSGSTSNYLARHARCPLLVFPRSADHVPARRRVASR